MPSSITLTVSHLPTSTSFFLSALQPLNYVFRGREEHTIGFGPVSPPNTPADFWITQEIPGVPAGAAHVAFPASSRAQVEDFFLAALKAGGKIHGEPCQRDASGYYSAAVIDFDGNSIEAVYRPGFSDESNKENEDVASVVSHRSRSVKAPSKSVVSTKVPTVVSQARSKAPSQTRSVAAPFSVSSLATPTPEQTQPKPKPQGDVLDTLINEAHSAANVARNLVNSVRPNLTASASSAPSTHSSSNGGVGAGEAIVGTLLGVAAGAALHYAFTNRSKESQSNDQDEPKPQSRRPSAVGRSITDPAIARPEYSSVGSGAYCQATGGRGYRAIEPAPSAYTYDQDGGQRLITMQDNDPPQTLVAPRSEYASTIRPPSRRMSVDSGFGPGPRDQDRHLDKDAVSSHVSSKASRHSKKGMKALEAPPTSYRAPTVLTTAETQASGKDKLKAGSRSGSRSRTRSLSRIMSLSGRPEEKPTRSRSQSRHSSRRSRRDEFDDEATTVLRVTEKLHRTTSQQSRAEHEHSQVHHSTSQVGSKAPSRASSRHTAFRTKAPDRDHEPHEYPLPPSRAATWAGSEAGSFVSARSKLGPANIVSAPRTIIGKLNPLRTGNDTQCHDFVAPKTESVVSKQKDLARLDVTDREVRPEDSVSQISVDSRRSKRSKASSRR
ncbi:uncharacterized protein Z518_08870 [Rhinocladiella mackenziei CBS 650.93]|uniref:VOC domain-containing protein n=1 Tax=Rhinocladiella mackenziei CBS 650.93 TaxID=1442369 RepID=A0A0D2FLR7_9EURO|nr:uncharacterized protein Z518_08870 [Rhinocladiella mackenziei CBS 650.93]KIX02927.1 hypothetical protein Z518_08870 [Rhinocladiella mackenziei CBS 650.93]